MPNNLSEYLHILPLIILGAGIFFAVIIEIYTAEKSELILPWFSAAVLMASAVYSVYTLNDTHVLFGGMVSSGGIASIFNMLFSLSAMLVVLNSTDYIKKYGTYYGEYYILLLSSVLGMSLMASARDLFIIFLGLELMSIPFYVLSGFNRKRASANEASLKYFLLGSFATGFIVYGIALIYGSAQTTSLGALVDNFPTLRSSLIFIAGMIILIIGFSFKIAAFPFHQWVPDVYQGAATSVTALMSTAGKSAAFGVLILLSGTMVASGNGAVFMPYFAAIAVCSMLYGSIVAISQNNIKRMLAYSSIAHAGYMCVGLASGSYTGLSGILFYLIAYAFMNIGAFAIVSVLETQEERNLEIGDYAGLSSTHPFLSAMMALFMFALSGLPPFAGFFGKYYVFISALESGLPWLAILGVLSSAISVYFYIRLVVLMYFKENPAPLKTSGSPATVLAVVIAAVIVVALGLFPGSAISTIAAFMK